MTIRFGIIGTGGIADQKLAPALARTRGAELWSVLSRDRARAREFAARHGARAPDPGFDDETAFLADARLDAVIIASPDRLHAAEAVAAAKARKHVLVEKPMATSAADARAMVDACRSAGVRLGVAYHLRFHQGHRALAAQIQQGALGDLRHARVQWTYKAAGAGNWRASNQVGRWWALAGVGTHCVDLVRWMLLPTCGEVVDVRALVSRAVYRGPHDETAIVALRFASGATAETVASVLFDSTSTVELFGSAGSAVCEGTLGPHGAGRIRMRGAEMPFKVKDPYEGEIADFVEAIEKGREPEVSGDEGLHNVEILDAAAPEESA